MAEMMCVGDIKEVFFIEVEFDKDLNELAGLGQKVAQVIGPNLAREQQGGKKMVKYETSLEK